MEWGQWNVFSQMDNANLPVQCFRGKRFRERECNPSDNNEHGEKCDDLEAKGHIDFKNEAGDDKETEWEEKHEYETGLIPSCSEYFVN